MLTNLFFFPFLYPVCHNKEHGFWHSGVLLQDFQAFEEELGGEMRLILFPQPHEVWASWLGLCVGACSGCKMESDRFHSSLLLEDLAMLSSGTFFYSGNENVSWPVRDEQLDK